VAWVLSSLKLKFAPVSNKTEPTWVSCKRNTIVWWLHTMSH